MAPIYVIVILLVFSLSFAFCSDAGLGICSALCFFVALGMICGNHNFHYRALQGLYNNTAKIVPIELDINGNPIKFSVKFENKVEK